MVNLLVAVMRVLHQPADTLARAEALLLVDQRGAPPSPHPGARAGTLPTWPMTTNSRAVFRRATRPRFRRARKSETGNLGLYELTEQLLDMFGLLGR
ncbi:MAG: hypothetical protein WKG07_04790 [Hymenobacter sp.]